MIVDHGLRGKRLFSWQQPFFLKNHLCVLKTRQNRRLPACHNHRQFPLYWLAQPIDLELKQTTATRFVIEQANSQSDSDLFLIRRSAKETIPSGL